MIFFNIWGHPFSHWALVSSWLPSYSQRDTTLLVTFLNQECNVFSDFLFCLFVHPTSFNRSKKARPLMSTSSHFSPTKNFWSWGASGQGRRSSTRCLPPARWPSSDLICPIFSNKWLYLNISRILQIHDQGNSDILLSVGWSFKMANTWDHWSMHDDSNRSILLLEASKYFLRHLFASTFVVKTVSSTQWSMQLNDQCNLVQCTVCIAHKIILPTFDNWWEWLILLQSTRMVDSGILIDKICWF